MSWSIRRRLGGTLVTTTASAKRSGDHDRLLPTTRLEAFSDGVFAIAITLLVIELHVPTGHEPLVKGLEHEWPRYLGYFVSIAFIGGVWIAHSTVTRFIKAADPEGLRVRRHRADAPADRLGRHHDRPADLPANGAGIQRPEGGPVPRAALAHHVRRRGPGRPQGRPAAPGRPHPGRVRHLDDRADPADPGRARADSGWWLVVPLIIAGCGLGLLVSQLNNYTLSPISDERVSEAAGVNSVAGSFGLSFGLAFAGAIMLATLSLGFTSLANSSTVLSPAEQQQVAHALETDAQIMSNTQLEKQLASHPEQTQNEIIRINTDARHLALQVALLIPILAGGLGLLNSFRMMRLPDPVPSEGAEGMVLG